MQDRLVWLLEHFELRAEVFHSGGIRQCVFHSSDEGVGHLHLLRSGSVQVESPGAARQLVETPSVIFYMKPTSHTLEPGPEGAELVCANVDFGVGLGNPLRLALPEVVVLPIETAPDLGATLNILFREATEDHCGRQAVLDRLSEVALIQMFRELMDRKLIELGLVAGLADERLAEAINAVHAEPEKHWTLEALASKAHMSRARFAVRFREIVGMTPGAYLSEWRLSLAQSLLRRGKPVSVVANEVGYANASALSRAFSAQKGVSPTAWLKQLQSQ